MLFRRGRRHVVKQNALRRPVEIVELAGPHAPQEGKQPEPAQAQRNGNEEQQHRHDRFPLFVRPTRNAFKTTMIDELDMAMAAMSGVTSPMMASGTAARL